MRRNLMIAAMLLTNATPTLAQTPPPPQTAADEDITVVGLGERAYKLNAQQLRAAVGAFEQNRAAFAPQARLMWFLMPRGPHPEVSLALKDNEGEVLPIPVSAEGSFTLPHDKILTGQWRLVTTAAKGAIRIQPVAMSPGATREQFRMGDARLSCRVHWGFISDQYSIVTRSLFSMVGGCASSSIGIYFSTDKPINAVTIDGWSKPIQYGQNNKSWRIPLHEKTISNEAVARVTYR